MRVMIWYVGFPQRWKKTIREICIRGYVFVALAPAVWSNPDYEMYKDIMKEATKNSNDLFYNRVTPEQGFAHANAIFDSVKVNWDTYMYYNPNGEPTMRKIAWVLEKVGKAMWWTFQKGGEMDW